jgi:hypothetical protein
LSGFLLAGEREDDLAVEYAGRSGLTVQLSGVLAARDECVVTRDECVDAECATDRGLLLWTGGKKATTGGSP